MVVKKAWIAATGTYSVDNTNEPLNPTVGEMRFLPGNPHPPKGDDKPEDRGLDRFDPEDQHLVDYLHVAALANIAQVEKDDKGQWAARGDPTEIAIQVFASRFHKNRQSLTKSQNEKRGWREMAEFPFDSDCKRMSTVYCEESPKGVTTWVFTKGAVERVLPCCEALWLQGSASTTVISKDVEKVVAANVECLAKQGLRVLALASKTISNMTPVDGVDRTTIEHGLTFLGLIGLYDPPRPESAAAVNECGRAGIMVHMLT